jgi:glycyl-tRNA synthetase beta chain
MAKDLIFEIGVEEIPASYIPPAVEALREALAAGLRDARLAFGAVRTYATPRRLAAIVDGVSEMQDDLERVVVGPPARIAFGPDGAPTKAATGFARSQGVKVSDLTVDGDYVRAKVLEIGRPAVEILPDVLAACVASLSFPKTMRWGPPERFARPIRWLVAMLGKESLALTCAGVTASPVTYGHRFLSTGPLTIGGAGDYVDVLAKGFVVADVEARRRTILEAAERAAAASGGRLVKDDALLEEVTFLVEVPTAFEGAFDERFLTLPRDVIVAAMKGHQRYFAVESPAGKLLPFFLCATNTTAEHIETIRRGHERVLESRLDDAEFYWREDTKTTLEAKVESLANVVWLEGLGSLYDKTLRLVRLTGFLSKWFRPSERDAALRAARLAKADLVTEMVKDGKEFTELQGTMGREYAAASGESPAVATAIYEHYLPRFAGDDLPSTDAGIMLSIADRTDSIVGCFSAGLVPTGSQDPYALRRQAIGLVRMIDEKRLPVVMSELVAEATVAYGVEEARRPEIAAAVLDFVGQRARNFFIDAGYSYDLVDAVLAASLSDLAGVRPRLTALAHFRANEDFAGLVIGARRATNILKGQPELPYDAALLAEPATRTLSDARRHVEGEVRRAIAGGEFDRAVRELLSLRRPIDDFFDEVLVMVEDEKLRTARLGLLADVRKLFFAMADFAKVVLEGEEAK